MKNFLKGSLVVTAVFFLGLIAFNGFRSDVVNGSVNLGNDYSGATTTIGMTTKNQIQVGQTTFGSIVISSSSAQVAGNIVVKNATSTIDAASTTVASFGSASPNGTYTFDVAMTRGLVLELPAGYNGVLTVTYR